ncbi:hypothetical protein CMK10_10530 [Candidatus Poribacteria bacterium]|jgi:hypothetical protein|nr:hypothetical protein [Candidatus Poribacteria bacterium]
MSETLTIGSKGGLFVADDEFYYKQAGLLQYFGELVVSAKILRDKIQQALTAGRLSCCFGFHRFTFFIMSTLQTI